MLKTSEISALLLAAGALFLSTIALPAVPWDSLQVADLRSFLHGEPPPPPKAPPPKQIAIVSTQAGLAADAQIEAFMRAYAEAIMARDGKRMLARLADTYAIDELPEDKKPADFFMQAIETMPGAAQIIITSVERSYDIRTAKIEIRYHADNIKFKTFRFDATGKLLWSDLFKLQRQRQGA
ncbi:MAG: hypothetical protein ABL931_07840 [Usitatibacteraceae bacterium]